MRSGQISSGPKFTRYLLNGCNCQQRSCRRCPRVVTKAVCGTTLIVAVASSRSEPIMTTEYTVGLRLQTRSEVLTIEAEEALIAALKAKHEHPDAVITVTATHCV
jgi:hypothetical protein